MSRRRLVRIYVLLDVLALCAAGAATLTGDAGRSSNPPFQWFGFGDASQILTLLLFVGVLIVLLDMNHLYKFMVYRDSVAQLHRLPWVILEFGIIVLGLEMILGSSWTAAQLIRVAGFLILTGVFLVAFRVLLFSPFLRFCYARGKLLRRALVVGAGSICEQFLHDFTPEPNRFGLKLLGVLDDRYPAGTTLPGGIPVVGSPAEVSRIATQLKVNEVLVSSEEDPAEPYFRMIDQCAGTGACVTVGSPKFLGAITGYTHDKYGRTDVFTICSSPLNAIVKRTTEPLLAAVGLVFLSPFLLLLALAIKIDSRGPVLFTQTRIGKDGRPFRFYKFRSMYAGSDTDKGRESQVRSFIRSGANSRHATTKIIDMTKVTRVGRLIRKTSMDELPQLLNVVRGEMSLVGPRPCLSYELENYDDWHRRRLNVLPGCTGVWQVLARSKVGFHEMVLQDLFYVYRFTLTLDIWVMLKTLPVMFFGKGGE